VLAKNTCIPECEEAFVAGTFNLLRSGRPAMRLLIAFLLAVFSGFGNSAVAQPLSASIVSPDQIDIKAYRTLFRRDLLVHRLADEADAAHDPKPYLRKVLAYRFNLSENDNASLDRLSIAYQREIDPIHAQTLVIIGQFHARFPSGVIPRGADASPPPELAQLQQQEDAVALRYRDLLRTSMHEEEFQQFHAKVRKTFGGATTK
jgi:hypothetical protein